MKILLDTDILKESVLDSSTEAGTSFFLNKMTEGEGDTLWISALSVGNEVANHLLETHRGTFTIVPLRQSTLLKAANRNGTDFESRVLMASAEELNLDMIISGDPSKFNDSLIPVFTPQEFLQKKDSGEWDKVVEVPFMDLKAQHHQNYNEIDNRFTDIIANTGFILGKHVDEFEKKFAAIHDARFSIGVSSGTDALHVALTALGIGPGDAVIVPVYTFIATAEAVSLTGAVPLFVDCDQYYNMDVEKLEELLRQKSKSEGKKVKAVIPVHLYGQPVNLWKIMEIADKYNLMVIEDACQAHLAEYKGRKVGNWGQFGTFSFYPGKNLGAYGEAGALITNNEDLYTKAKMIRQHGEIERYHHNRIGHNYRMEAFQGAVLSSKLRYLEEWTEKRRKIAYLYNELLEGVEGIQLPCEMDETHCVYHLYVIQADERDELRRYLQEKGITTGLHYPVPLHMQKAYQPLGYWEGEFPMAERAAKRILSLPLFPELTKAQIGYVCDNIKEFYRRTANG